MKTFIHKQMQERRAKYKALEKRQKSEYVSNDEVNNVLQDAFHKHVVARIGERIRKQFGYKEVEVYGPQGIGARVTLILKRSKNKSAWKLAAIEPHEDDLYIKDYRTDTGEFRDGTIGQLNGMNYPSIKITGMGLAKLHSLILAINKRSLR